MIGELAAPDAMSFAGAAKHVGILDRAGLVERGGGWLAHLAALEKRVAGERVENFWVLHAAAEARAVAALDG